MHRIVLLALAAVFVFVSTVWSARPNQIPRPAPSVLVTAKPAFAPARATEAAPAPPAEEAVPTPASGPSSWSSSAPWDERVADLEMAAAQFDRESGELQAQMGSLVSTFEFQDQSDSGDDKMDAPHKLYKEAYNLILDEEWKSARKKFAELRSSYPKSEFMDDAAYWSAYAQKHIDRTKAQKEYKAFISDFPNSQYYDDAVADLDQLKDQSVYVATTRPGRMHVYSTGDSSGAVAISGGRAPRAYSPGQAVGISSRAAAIARLDRDLSRKLTTVRMPRLPRTPSPWTHGLTMTAPRIAWGGSLFDEDSLDEKTRLKLDALQALGETKEDSLSYRTLKDVALDRKQAKALRITALDQLSHFRKYDVLPVFIQVAKSETDPDMQNTAIDVISDLGGEKTRGVDALVEIYRALPSSSKDQRSSIFYAIADIGNDKAVDFLSTVARSSDDYQLRQEAVSYLGNIGGEKARKALLELLNDK